MDIKSINSGAGSRLNTLANDTQQKKADDSKALQNAAQQKQRQDKLELSSEATMRNQAVKLNSIDNKKIEQKLSKYEAADAYKEVAKKLDKLIPVQRKA